MSDMSFIIVNTLIGVSALVGVTLMIYAGTQIDLKSTTYNSMGQVFIAGVCLLLMSVICVLTYAVFELFYRMSEQKLNDLKPTIVTDSPMRKKKAVISSMV